MRGDRDTMASRTASGPAAPRRCFGLLQAAPAHSAASAFCKV